MASEKDKKGSDDKGSDNKSPATYDEDTIRGLARLLDETGLTEIEIERGGERIRIGRAPRTTQVAAPALPLGAPSPMVPVAGSDPGKHPGAVPSPMVGTAYLAPSPDAQTLVEDGQPVEFGEPLVIIE